MKQVEYHLCENEKMEYHIIFLGRNGVSYFIIPE
jgi:hypothetical protein